MERQILNKTKKFLITNYDECSEGKVLGTLGIMGT